MDRKYSIVIYAVAQVLVNLQIYRSLPDSQ